jgi:hypothetical protein
MLLSLVLDITMAACSVQHFGFPGGHADDHAPRAWHPIADVSGFQLCPAAVTSHTTEHPR